MFAIQRCVDTTCAWPMCPRCEFCISDTSPDAKIGDMHSPGVNHQTDRTSGHSLQTPRPLHKSRRSSTAIPARLSASCQPLRLTIHVGKSRPARITKKPARLGGWSPTPTTHVCIARPAIELLELLDCCPKPSRCLAGNANVFPICCTWKTCRRGDEPTRVNLW